MSQTDKTSEKLHNLAGMSGGTGVLSDARYRRDRRCPGVRTRVGTYQESCVQLRARCSSGSPPSTGAGLSRAARGAGLSQVR